MAKAKLTADNFAAEVGKILSKYEEEISDSLGEITQDVAKAGATAIKNEANEKFKDVHLKKGRYGSGWTTTITKDTRLNKVVTIHNAKYPGLPHLLENGHLNRNGSRTPGRPHIAPVEDQIAEKFEKEVVTKL